MKVLILFNKATERGGSGGAEGKEGGAYKIKLFPLLSFALRGGMAHRWRFLRLVLLELD